MLKYLIITSADLESGVMKKAIAQVSGFNSTGLRSELIVLTPPHTHPTPPELPAFVKVVSIDGVSKGGLRSRLGNAIRIRGFLHDIIRSSGPCDILYYRGVGFRPAYLPLVFFRPFHRCKCVSEHQSFQINEALLYGKYYHALQNLLIGGFLASQSDGIIGVTEEITEHLSRRMFCRNIPKTTIANGFDVRSVSVRRPPSLAGKDLHLLFVGNVSRWHGVDRLIQGISEYRGSFCLHLHIVGNGDEIENLKELKNTIAPDADIFFHGFYKGKELDAIFDQCHVAFGSLGVHRKGLGQATTLKAREYCARGIPFVLSEVDPDFPDTFEYCLHVIPDDTPIEMDQVMEFAVRVNNDPTHPDMMRRYAEQKLDWNVKVRATCRFIMDNLLR